MKWPTVAALAILLAATPAAAGPEVTVLLHHPDDGVDPFGFPYGPGGDYFTTRYAPLVADKQRFDFPFFVADGVLPIEQLPDPNVPVEATRLAYEAATQQRLATATPATLRVATTASDAAALVAIEVVPVAVLEESFHVMAALSEDPVHHLPLLTNGVEDHRFTVRAVVDLGSVDLRTTSNHTHSFPLQDSWQRDRLVVAVWLQKDAPSPRFDAREIVQATHARLGADVVQDSKGVLLEMLSATWCDPCLYGDLALEAVAVAHGAAEPLDLQTGSRYFEAPTQPILTVAFSLLVGLAIAWLGGRKS